MGRTNIQSDFGALAEHFCCLFTSPTLYLCLVMASCASQPISHMWAAIPVIKYSEMFSSREDFHQLPLCFLLADTPRYWASHQTRVNRKKNKIKNQSVTHTRTPRQLILTHINRRKPMSWGATCTFWLFFDWTTNNMVWLSRAVWTASKHRGNFIIIQRERRGEK